jgi:hypothetical protein
MIVDVPELVREKFDEYDHVVVMISDGFGLLQWLKAKQQSNKAQSWESNGALETERMATIFPSETGAAHYSFITGQFPGEHGRDNIRKTSELDEVALFEKARERGAYAKAMSYLPQEAGGFSTVMGEHADEFVHLDNLKSKSAALGNNSKQEISTVVATEETSLTVFQHNQIDHIHEAEDETIEPLTQSVRRNILNYVEELAVNIDEDTCFILTADHGMIRTKHESYKDIKGREMRKELKKMDERTGQLGQRVIALKDKSSNKSYGQNHMNEYFEVLPKRKLQEFKALTDDKCSGRVLRMRKRYYSADKEMTATHGAFTFDEMFIPFTLFDLNSISEIAE